jgi:deoxyribonuclease-4
MTKVGAHISAAGGASNAPKNAALENCETFQFFIGSPKSYATKPIADEEVEKFHALVKEHSFKDYFVHAPYLVNLASKKNSTRHGSIRLLRHNLEQADRLGVKGVMFHTGSGKDHDTKEEAIAAAIKSINKILDGYEGKTKLLIENAAGAGATLGVTFEEVGQLLNGVDSPEKMGVCLDTAHAFGSGYDLTDPKAVDAALKEFGREIGLRNLLVVQANDSKVECGSNKDRHEHIGDGFIGADAFEYMINHKSLKSKPWVLETEPDKRGDDLNLLKSFRE